MLKCNLNDKEVIASVAIDKAADYRCPECGGPVMLKRGQYKIPHFAHKSNNGCTYGEGMTEAHLLAQMQIYEILHGAGFLCDIECNKFKKRRADVYAEIGNMKVVFEIQHSSIPPEEILFRNQFYSDNDCAVIWILTEDFYGKFKALVNPYRGVSMSYWQMRINSMYGCVYVWREGQLLAYQFENAFREADDFSEAHYLKKTFDKVGYAKVDLLWGIKNGILTRFVEDLYHTTCFGLSPDIDYAANWKYPAKCYSFADPISVLG